MDHEAKQQHKTCSMDLSSLPFEVIAAILSHVPLKERLSSCALVCSTWAAAGAGASKVLAVQLRSQEQADNLAAWLAQHGAGIEQLSVATDHQAYEESLLQWQQQRKQRALDGDVAVQTVPGGGWLVPGELLMQSENSAAPLPQCFTASLPLQHLHALRRLSLENVRVRHFNGPLTNAAAEVAAADVSADASTAAAAHDASASTSTSAVAAATAALDGEKPAQQQQPRSTAAAALPATGPGSLSHLTHLHADSSFVSLLRLFRGDLGPLRGLEVLRLTLGPQDSEFLGAYWAKQGNEALAVLCGACTRLQRLQLATSHVEAAGLKELPLPLLQVSCLRRLQHVELHVPGGSLRRPVNLAPWLAPLPAQRLTQLVLKPLASRQRSKTLDLGLSSLGQLAGFSCLRHLEISHGTSFDPATLAPLTALTHLSLSEVDLTKAPPAPRLQIAYQVLQQHQQQQQGQQQPQEQQQEQPRGSAAMLAVLPCLQELRVLQLSPGLLPSPAAPVEQYSALTASSHLTLLSLYHCQLPAGAAAAIFQGGARPLPSLRCLRMPQPPAGQRPCSADALNAASPFLTSGAAAALRAARESSSSSADGSSTSANGTGGSSSGGVTLGPAFGPGSLDGLAACCPNLGQLWVTAAVAADADLAPLRLLAGLTELQLGGAVVDDAAAQRVLCGLSQLQRLDLVGSPRFTDGGLACLTALRALTSLQVRDCGLSHCTAGLGQVLYMCRRQEGMQSGTPVCERLRQQCINSRDCLLVMLQQRDSQLAAAAAALAAAEARAAAAEARAAAAEARTAATATAAPKVDRQEEGGEEAMDP